MRQNDVKKVSAQAQRRQMNERRSELTQKIRKTKRMHVVALKRRFTTADDTTTATNTSMSDISILQSTPISSTSIMPVVDVSTQAPSSSSSTSSSTKKLSDLAWDYIRSKSGSSLLVLQIALVQNNDTTSSTSSLFLQEMLGGDSQRREIQPSEDMPAMQLVNSLSFSLTSSNEGEIQLMAARVLTNLAATENSSNRYDDDTAPAAMTTTTTTTTNYYQWQPDGWCDILCRSQALPALVQVLTATITNATSQAAFIGVNGGGGGGSSSNVAVTTPTKMTMDLCQQCCWALGNICGDSQHTRDCARDAGAILPLIKALEHGLIWNHAGICRNASFALSNLARGTGPGLPFVQHLSPALISQVIMTPEQKHSNIDSVSWWEVAYEACWVLAYLTAREHEAVDLLMGEQPNLSFSCTNQSIVCEALSTRLESLTKIVRTADTLNGFGPNTLRVSIPCLRSVGNIATACQGQHVSSLLLSRGGSIAKSLATLIELGSYPSSRCNGDLSEIAIEASWVAASLLCDAGLQDHPSTTYAVPALMAVLCNTITSEYAKLELKREVSLALSNMIAAPPGKTDMGHQWQSRPLRDEFLETMAQTPRFIGALTDLLTCLDMDAVRGSIYVLNGILRRVMTDRIKREFLEAGGVDALEKICDYADQTYEGSSTSSSEQCADIAADLIDDLFDETNDDDNEMALSPEASCNGTFAFGLASNAAPQQFDFCGSANNKNLGLAATNTTNPPTQGRGRGRGKPMVPAWMANKT